jgi:hypothetical protein
VNDEGNQSDDDNHRDDGGEDRGRARTRWRGTERQGQGQGSPEDAGGTGEHDPQRPTTGTQAGTLDRGWERQATDNEERRGKRARREEKHTL